MKVKVTGPYQIVHDGKTYVEGDTVEAQDVDAAQWVTAGYAQEVKPSGSKAETDAPNKAQKTSPNKSVSSK